MPFSVSLLIEPSRPVDVVFFSSPAGVLRVATVATEDEAAAAEETAEAE
jgi:hypothetical protein